MRFGRKLRAFESSLKLLQKKVGFCTACYSVSTVYLMILPLMIKCIRLIRWVYLQLDQADLASIEKKKKKKDKFSLKSLIQRLHICKPAKHVMSLLGCRQVIFSFVFNNKLYQSFDLTNQFFIARTGILKTWLPSHVVVLRVPGSHIYLGKG